MKLLLLFAATLCFSFCNAQWFIRPTGNIASSWHLYENDNSKPVLTIGWGLDVGKRFNNTYVSLGAGFLQTGSKIESFTTSEDFLCIPVTISQRWGFGFIQVLGAPAFPLKQELKHKQGSFTSHIDVSDNSQVNFMTGLQLGFFAPTPNSKINWQFGFDGRYFVRSLNAEYTDRPATLGCFMGFVCEL